MIHRGMIHRGMIDRGMKITAQTGREMAWLGWSSWKLPVGSVLLGMLIGTAVWLSPFLAAALVLGIPLALYALVQPEQTSLLLLVFTAISIQYVFDAVFMGMDLLSLYKLCVLALLLPYVCKAGIHHGLTAPLAAFVALLLISLLLSRPDAVTAMSNSPVKAFIGLAVPFFILIVRWNRETAHKHIQLICLLPLISVLAGGVLHLAGLHELYVIEFTGAFRLSGANISAHLAMLAFVGMIVAVIEMKRNPVKARWFLFFAGLNFAILLATGTRGPILASVAVILYTVWDLCKQFLKGKAYYLIPIGLLTLVIATASFLQWENMKKRSFERSTAEGIDLSGRSEAWSYFIAKGEDTPWFGKGLGAVLYANDGTIFEGFVVPHNEYIRFYYDTGLFGAGLLFVSILVMLGWSLRHAPPVVRPYLVAFFLGFLIYSFSDNTMSTLQFTLPFCWYLNALANVAEP
ncbi:O-antigen ligase family protein [Marinicrinis sediminis]|uniref:O-antigen ligase family protein n=1 Tax=Marinicrinis sediminis TaxID=1652465 RepID=A0ABW5RDC1_9BACL